MGMTEATVLVMDQLATNGNYASSADSLWKLGKTAGVRYHNQSLLIIQIS
jgi:hypothetical protein